MIDFTGIKLYLKIGAGIVAAAFIAWVIRIDYLRNDWKTKYEVLSTQAGDVLYEIRVASGKKKLAWADVPAEIRDLDHARDSWKMASNAQSVAIDRMAFDTAKMKKLNAELRAKAQVELEKRKAAYERLDKQAMTPGDRADCIAQIKAAEAALDTIYEAGL